MKRSLSFLLAIILCFAVLPIQAFAVSDNDLYTQYPYYLNNEEYSKIESSTYDICQEILDSQKGFHEFESILATIVDDAKSIATGEIGAKLGLNSSYEESIRESAIRKLLAAISAENMSENEYNRKIASEAKKWMGVYKDVASPFKDEAELSSFLANFLSSLGIDSKNVSDLQSILVKKIPKLFTAGSQGINAYQTVLSLTAIYGYRLDSVRVLMDSVDKNSDLYKDLQHTLHQMMDPAKYFNENYTSKAVLGVVQKWVEKGTLGKVLGDLKKGSETVNNASWALSLCKSLYFTFIYEGYKVDDYVEAVYLLGYASDIIGARTKLFSDFCNGVASNDDIARYQKLFDLGIIAQIAALHSFAGLLSVYNRYDLKTKAEDQAALLSWNHDYSWYIKQCRKCLEADLAAGKAVKRTVNNQIQPANNSTTVANNGTQNTSQQGGVSVSNVVSEASALVGKYPYVLGGKSPSDGGFDCSGLVYYVYHNRLGYNMTYQQVWSRSVPGDKIESKSSLAAGDIVFGLNNSGGWHTGIYIGNSTMIHAGSSKGVSKTSINGTWFTFKFAIRPSNLKQDTSIPPTHTTPQKLQVASTQTGSWRVTVPANHNTIYLYSSATSTVKADQISKSSDEFCITGVFQQAVLSDGTTRYCASFGTSNGSKDYWFTLTDRMSVIDRNTQTTCTIKSGEWGVSVPRDFKMVLYDQADSTSPSGSYTTEGPSDTQGFLCTQQAIFSDGTIRYATGFFENNVLVTNWFTLTNEMLVEDYESFPTYAITLNANGGNVSPSTITVRQGSTYGELPQPTRSGYIFVGWYTSAEGGTQAKATLGLLANANHTLYAHWSINGIVASGSWNSVMTTSSGSWNLDGNGTLTVTAVGTLYKLHNYGDSLAGYEDQVKHIVIKDGPTGIYNLCIGMKNLVSVELPSSLTSVGVVAFKDCPLLEKISIPPNVSDISYTAFNGCTSLTNISISDQNPWYCSVDGVVFSKDMKKMVLFPEGRSGSYVIPSGVTIVELGAFPIEPLQNLNTLEIPDSVVEIKCASWELDYWQSVKLRVHRGSYGEEFAKKNSLNYEIVD